MWNNQILRKRWPAACFVLLACVNTPLLCSQNSGTPQDDLIKLRTELKKVRTELKEMQDAFSSFKNVNTTDI